MLDDDLAYADWLFNKFGKRSAQLYLAGLIDGIHAYAWWKDGKQWVGTSGTTYESVILKIREKYKEISAKEDNHGS